MEKERKIKSASKVAASTSKKGKQPIMQLAPVQAASANKKRKRAIWLSYDLGLRGDYSGLYAWLDAHKARECGDATAFFEVELAGDTGDWLREELTRNVKLVPKDRIYAIYHDDAGNMKGKFISGGRKRAPWEGYSQLDVAEDIEDAA